MGDQRQTLTDKMAEAENEPSVSDNERDEADRIAVQGELEDPNIAAPEGRGGIESTPKSR